MMLDMKRTFDEVVESQASPEKAAQILANPFYVALSSSFAGTQEYMAMEKLGQLHAGRPATGRWDLIVVDTPPSRSALDFLDAPERLSQLPRRPVHPAAARPGQGAGQADDGRAAAWSPARSTKILGAQVLERHADVRRGLRHAVRRLPAARARRPTSCCRPGRRSWWSPRRSRTRCARRRTSSSGSRRSGCRWPGWWSTGRNRAPLGWLSRASRRWSPPSGWRTPTGSTAGGLTAGLLRLQPTGPRIVAREARLRPRFAAAHPDVPTAVVPALSTDVHDLDGLRLVGELLSLTRS